MAKARRKVARRRCPLCNREYGVGRDGRINNHDQKGRRGHRCMGSKMKVKDTTTKWNGLR